MSVSTFTGPTLVPRFWLPALLAVLLSAPLATGAADEKVPDGTVALEQQRSDFLRAREALRRGDLGRYRRLEAGLDAYPLFPYLRYEYLRTRLRQEPAAARAFLEQFPDTPMALMLRRNWLADLARRERWGEFLALYDGLEQPDTSMQCLAVQARLKGGERDEALWAEVDRFWLVGRSQPDECDGPFALWRKAGHMTRDKVLGRIELAFESGQLGLVSYLSALLPQADQGWIKRWRRMHQSPAAELRRLAPEPTPFWSAKLFTYGVRRLAGRDAEAADGFLARHADYGLTSDQVARAERSVALGLALQRHPDGAARLAELAGRGEADAEMRHWRVRAALWQQDWLAVLGAVEALPPEELAEPDWQYWRARALQALGHEDVAATLYAQVAGHRSYYGFLAAARVGQPPTIASVPLPVADHEVERLAAAPAMRRIEELLALRMTLEARREWRDATARMEPEQLRVAAKLAHRWGWHDQVILALGRTGFFDDLELRFPTPFAEHVDRATERRDNLDPAFVFAVMRQESAFGEKARSPVGALGLMQLMPATARSTARNLRMRAPSTAEILTAENNIRLGAAYLSGLLEQYGGNRLYALAAYNAGPGRVARWRSESRPVPADVWVANITFDETRNYLERILAYTAVYEWRLGRAITPISQWVVEELEPSVIRAASGPESGSG